MTTQHLLDIIGTIDVEYADSVTLKDGTTIYLCECGCWSAYKKGERLAILLCDTCS